MPSSAMGVLEMTLFNLDCLRLVGFFLLLRVCLQWMNAGCQSISKSIVLFSLSSHVSIVRFYSLLNIESSLHFSDKRYVVLFTVFLNITIASLQAFVADVCTQVHEVSNSIIFNFIFRRFQCQYNCWSHKIIEWMILFLQPFEKFF